MARAAARAQARGASRLAAPTPSDGDVGPGLGGGWRPVPGGTVARRLLQGRRIKLWRRQVTQGGRLLPAGTLRSDLGLERGARLRPRGSRCAAPLVPKLRPQLRSRLSGSGPCDPSPAPPPPAALRLSGSGGATAHGHWLILEEVESVCRGRGSWLGSPCDPASAVGIPATRGSLLFPWPLQLCGSPPCASAGASGTANHNAQGSSVPKAT